MISNRWFVIDKLNSVRVFVERALSVYDDYNRIVNGEYEFSYDSETDIVDLEGNDPDALEPEDVLFGEYERANDMLLNYQEIVVRAALNELNSTVEYELKLVASFTLSKQTGKPLSKSWQKDRDGAVKVIENSYALKLLNLPGYAEVEKVRNIINAYKHDDGYSRKDYEMIYDDGENFAEIQKRYKLDVDDVLRCIDSAKDFVQALPGVNLQLGEDVSKRLHIYPKSKKKD
ncbi:MAG: hypothetical protein HY863_17715 [Chloroflexi bacterium]|nr:hypothetical protein [Chloroflexota bacterium]